MKLRREFLLAVVVCLGMQMRAQVSSVLVAPPPPPAPGRVTGCACDGGFGPGQREEPYSLVEKTMTVRVLADGTTITHVHEEKRMRDSEGRTRTETILDPEGERRLEFVNIFDPRARMYINLSPSTKRANVSHMPEPTPPARMTAEERARLAEMRAKAQAARAGQPTVRPEGPEALGQRNIAGVLAEGRRMVHVIKVGEQGNDRELKMVTEYWRSPDLRIDLERTTDDPINGKTTTVVTELERGEPDPALFKVPEGYKVVEQQQ